MQQLTKLLRLMPLLILSLSLSWVVTTQAQNDAPVPELTDIETIILDGGYDDFVRFQAEVVEALPNNHYRLEDASAAIVIDGGGSPRDLPLDLPLGESVIVTGEVDFELEGIGVDVFTVELSDGTLITASRVLREIGDERNAERQPARQAPSLSLADALAIVAEEYPDARAVAAELWREDGRLAYDIVLNNGLAIYVEANTGAIIEVEAVRGDDDWDDDRDRDDEREAAPANTGIDRQAAIGVALSQYPAAQVLDVDLEREDGRLAYDIELNNGLAVYVDANTGEIIEIEPLD